MVEGMEVTGFVEIPDDKKSKGMTIVAGADYLSIVKKGVLPEGWQKHLEHFYAQDEIFILKITKKSEKEVNIRPIIYDLHPQGEGIYMRVAAGSVQNLKPEPVLEAFLEYMNMLGEETDGIEFAHHRLETLANTGSEEYPDFVPLSALGTEII